MKITKPKENQILIEDNKLKNFKLENDTPSGLEQSKYDKVYEGLISCYRNPGMTASKQVFFGNKISIATMMFSMLQNLIDNNVFCKKEINDMANMLNDWSEYNGR